MIMLTLKRLSVAVAVGSLVACSESVMSPEPLLPDAPALAANTTNAMERQIIPFAMSLPVQCGTVDEVVDFTGELLWMTKVTTKGDGSMTVMTRSQPRNVRGVGASTGIVYRGVGMAQQFEHTLPSGQTYVSKWIEIARFIAPGPGNDLHMKTRIQRRIGENGQVVVTLDESEMECR